MKLLINCTNCNKQFYIENKSIGRNYLADEIGEYFEKRCSHCNHKKEYHVNQVEATESGLSKKIGIVIGVFLMVFITVFVWNKGAITNVGLITGIAIIITTLSAGNSSAANAFNQYKIKPTQKV